MAKTYTDDSSLEGSSNSVEDATGGGASDTDSLDGSGAGSAAPVAAEPVSKPSLLKRFSQRVNIYLLLFILVLLIAGGVVLVSALSQQRQKATDEKEETITSQTLPAETLKQLANSDATVGDPKQVLNVQSNAVFAGKVLVRDNLDVAGQIRVGGALSLPGITVSGESNFDQVQVNKALNIGGDASILGQLNVKKNVSVTGGGTFGGGLTAPQIATSNLQLLGDLNLTRHIAAGGATPGRSNGGSLGAGGTSSVSGSDIAGSININTGSGTAAGCMVNVNFVQRYNRTPYVIITPVGSPAAGIDYYVNRSSGGFSICSTNAPPAGSSFGFDYMIMG